MIKSFIFSLLFLVFTNVSFSQTFNQAIINASGGSSIINNNTYEWSFAEMVDVATYNTGQNFVTTGLLQPTDEKVSIHLLPNSNTFISIYPNPFISNVNLSIQTEDFKDIKIIVKNMLGQLVYQQSYILSSNNEIASIKLDHLCIGPYVIEVYNSNLLLTEKIIKND